ncbi:hypothetical protein D9M68_742630 [compost metagenome]
MGGGAGGLGGAALHPHGAGHHVLGHADTDVAVHGDAGLLVHAGAVVAGVALDIDAHGLVHAHGQVVLAGRVGHHPFAVLHFAVQGLVQITHRGAGKVDCLHASAPQARSQMYMVAGSGSQTFAFSMPGRLARAWYSEAMAT